VSHTSPLDRDLQKISLLLPPHHPSLYNSPSSPIEFPSKSQIDYRLFGLKHILRWCIERKSSILPSYPGARYKDVVEKFHFILAARGCGHFTSPPYLDGLGLCGRGVSQTTRTRTDLAHPLSPFQEESNTSSHSPFQRPISFLSRGFMLRIDRCKVPVKKRAESPKGGERY